MSTIKKNKDEFSYKKQYTPKNWIEAFNVAIEGVILATKTERNMKIHFLAAAAVIFAAIFLKLPKIDFLLIFISAIMVLSAELFNTSIEYFLDLFFEGYSEKTAAIKNIAAGSVLIASFGAFIVGYEIFSKYLYSVLYYLLIMIKTDESNMIIAVISIIFVIVIIIKAIFNSGKPLSGGMPSGHSAIAFSIWLMVSLITLNPIVSLLTFILAFLVASSRKKTGIHTASEVVAGSLIGIIITALAFKFFYF
jgi:diacylglycerol kinase (ATP)